MKRFCFLAAAVLTAVVFCGCSSMPLLDIGEYRINESGRKDFICVYQDMIFLQIKSPKYAIGSLEYWNWAGKYFVSDNGQIILDMDRETAKRWNFYFTFLRKRNGIVLNELSDRKGYLLRYQIPEKRKDAQPGYIPTGSTGTDHNYAPLPPGE